MAPEAKGESEPLWDGPSEVSILALASSPKASVLAVSTVTIPARDSSLAISNPIPCAHIAWRPASREMNQMIGAPIMHNMGQQGRSVSPYLLQSLLPQCPGSTI